MKKIQITIGQLRLFRKIIRTPIVLTVENNANIIDIIGELDALYQQAIINDNISHHQDFLDEKMLSLLQLLWNPKTESFYEDVGLEARTAPPEGKSLPIEIDWKFILPNESWAVLTPDSGC